MADSHGGYRDASMGPLFFRAENGIETVVLVCHQRLQWGRSFSERRTAIASPSSHHSKKASMGPLFFRAENESCKPKEKPAPELQWGRSFSERRTGRRNRGTSQPDRFNGAALFQSGEHADGKPLLKPGDERFNGAALFQSGERSSHTLPVSARRASMGPLFFRAENAAARRRCPERHTLQWGRSFSERRT